MRCVVVPRVNGSSVRPATTAASGHWRGLGNTNFTRGEADDAARDALPAARNQLGGEPSKDSGSATAGEDSGKSFLRAVRVRDKPIRPLRRLQ